MAAPTGLNIASEWKENTKRAKLETWMYKCHVGLLCTPSRTQMEAKKWGLSDSRTRVATLANGSSCVLREGNLTTVVKWLEISSKNKVAGETRGFARATRLS